MPEPEPPAFGRVPQPARLAARQLVRELESLARLAFVICGDRGRAEDAAAEAVSRVWERSQRVDVAEVRPYLRRALVNTLTRSSTRSLAERRLLDVVSQGARSERPIAEVVAERTDLRRALDTLPAKQRVVLALRYFEALSDAEIAETLRLRPGTVKSRAARGLSALRDVLELDRHPLSGQPLLSGGHRSLDLLKGEALGLGHLLPEVCSCCETQ
jgi:RNA polymerase sigma factor (sigma-70 family)